MITDMDVKVPAWLLGLFVILFLLITCDGLKKVSQGETKIKTFQDSIIKVKDKNGVLTYKVHMLEADNHNQVLEIQSTKKTIMILQDELKQYKGKTKNSIAFSGQTKFDTIIKTEIKYVHDTLYEDGDTILIPSVKYAVNHNDKWINVNFESDSSTTEISIKVQNEYSVTLIRNKKKYEALVKNYNPYSSISEISAVSLQGVPKPKRFGLGLQVGYGVNSSLQLQPYLGVGLSYSLIRF